MKKLSIWREYSPVFEATVFRVYEDGSYLKTFMNQDDAIKWAESYRDLPDPVVALRNGDYVVKYEYSCNLEEMRYIMYYKGSYHSSFKTLDEAIDKIDWAKDIKATEEEMVWQS